MKREVSYLTSVNRVAVGRGGGITKFNNNAATGRVGVIEQGPLAMNELFLLLYNTLFFWH